MTNLTIQFLQVDKRRINQQITKFRQQLHKPLDNGGDDEDNDNNEGVAKHDDNPKVIDKETNVDLKVIHDAHEIRYIYMYNDAGLPIIDAFLNVWLLSLVKSFSLMNMLNRYMYD